ncbi:MAG: endolytic transglycosylase MltG [Mariprofundaceae bacterium]
MKPYVKHTLTGALVLAVVSLAAVTAWLYVQVHAESGPAEAVELSVPSGASSGRIAELLARQHVIESPFLFRLYVRITGKASRLRSGYYRFAGAASLQQVVERLVRGDVLTFQVTVPEGLRTDQVLALLAEQTEVPLLRWQQALHQLLPDEPEGRLLPETYQYTKPVDPQGLLRAMWRAQQQLLAELTDVEAEQERLRIMASIIEKETALADERPIVAAVIRNRLQRNMPLQMDPTVIYGIWKTRGAFSGNIHRRDLSSDTPWNTYTRRGLPPTPIGNPGADSLRAAAHPADSDALYFVADGKGGHLFASTLAEHQANVRRWVRIERKQNRLREKNKHAK